MAQSHFPSSRKEFIIKSKGKWNPIAIECDDGIGDYKDFEGLITIEELTDYDVSNSKLSKKRKTQKENDREHDGDCDHVKKNKNKKRLKTKSKSMKMGTSLNHNQLSDDICNKSSVNKLPPKSLIPIAIESPQRSPEIDMSAWDNLFVPDSVIKALRELKFDSPTPIQTLAIPSAVRDRLDILGAAETGSGKTLAFAIPLIHFIMNEKQFSADAECNSDMPVKRLRALVLTPTRELAIQVNKHIHAVAKYSDVSVNVVVGGMSVQKQERIINKQCPDILVATPGRVWELIEQNTIQHLNVEVISKLKYLVIDEADRMTEKGHFEEVKRIIELIKQKDNHVKGRQIFVFSATLTLIHDLPKRMRFTKRKKKPNNKVTQSQKLDTLIEALGMRERHTKVIDLTREGIGTPNEQMLTETKINCLMEEKDLYLYYFICTYPGRTLIFCNSKDCLRRLVNVLKTLQLNPLSLHASMPQKRRLTNLERFTSNANGLLIASDVAARGLDIANVDHVVHYQIPRTAEIYIHRSGRTARASNKGLSLMLCEPKEEAHFYQKLCQTMNRGNDLHMFPIDHSFLKLMKQRVALAQRCDQLEHKIRKDKASNDWFQNAAKQCDIEIDDDLIDTENSSNRNVNEIRQLKSMKTQLNAMIKKKLVARNRLTSFVTKTGTVNLPITRGERFNHVFPLC